jgi:hypothetical protein
VSENRRRVVAMSVIIFCVAAVLVGKAYTALMPELSDAHYFAYIGGRWLQGAIPYVDIWDNKPPGIFALIAGVFSVFPNSFVTLAVVDGLFSLAAAGVVYALCRACSLPRDAAILSTLAAVGASNLVLYTERGVLPEVYLLLPAAAAMLCFVVSFPTFKLRWVFAAGLCAGAASVFKPTGLSPMLAQVAFLGLLLLIRSIRVREFSKIVLVLVAGAASAWIPAVWYFGPRGGLGALLYFSFLFNVEYGVASQPSPMGALFNTLERLKPMASLTVAAVMLGVLWAISVARPGERGRTLSLVKPAALVPLMLLWVGADVAGALAGGRSYGHYFLPLTISASVAGGFAYWWMTHDKARAPITPTLRTALFLLILAPIGLEQASDFRHLASSLRWGTSKHPKVVAGEYLGAVKGPDETLFTWDYLPAVYYYSGLANVVRQLDAGLMDSSPAAHERFGPVILGELRADLPDYIVDSTNNIPWRAQVDRFYREFRDVVDAEYGLLEEIPYSTIRIYRRQPRGVDGPDAARS